MKVLIKKLEKEYKKIYIKTVIKIHAFISNLIEEISIKNANQNLLKARSKILFEKNNNREFKVSLDKIYDDQLSETNDSKTLLVNNVCVRGKSKIVVKNGIAAINAWTLNHDQEKSIYDYYIQEEVLLDVAFNEENTKIAERIQTIEKRVEGKWLSLLSPCNDNYMHFISETLPAIYKSSSENSNYGVLLDWDTPPSCIEAVKVLSDNSPINYISRCEGVRVEKLIVSKEVSLSFWWPRKKNELKGFYSFDKDSLLNIRERVLSFYEIEPVKNCNLFIPRSSKFRGMLNESELKEYIRSESSFEEANIGVSLKTQVMLFSKINILLTQAGALLANIIFMPKGSKVICLIADSESVNYEYFHAYAEIFGVEIIYLKCYVPNIEFYKSEYIADELHPMNALYNVSINDVKNIFKEYGL